MTPANRLLACLDVCEASGLFNPVDMAHNRSALAVGMLLRSLYATGSHPSLRLEFRVDGTLIGIAGANALYPSDARETAATLARVADVAAKCDAILRAP